MAWNKTTLESIEKRIENALAYNRNANSPIQKENAALLIKAAQSLLAGWNAAQVINESDSTTTKLKKAYITAGSVLYAAEWAAEKGLAESKAAAARMIEKAIDSELCGNDDIDNAAAIMRDERNTKTKLWDAEIYSLWPR